MNNLIQIHQPHLLIKNAHIVDPQNEIDGVMDLELREMEIIQWGKNLEVKDAEVFDAKGLYLMPGFVDLHVHFREPGFEHKETLESGIHSAIQGGFVGCATMPNTKPACDNEQIVKYQIEKGERYGFNIFPVGALTQGREGKKISEMAEMKQAGAVGVSDDGSWVHDSGVARRAYEYAATYNLPVMTHAEDCCLSRDGVMNEGVVSTKLGVRAKPNASEDLATARDIELARLIGCHLHVCHISTKVAVDLVRRAKAGGVKVTAEATPHHIALTDEKFLSYDANFKMNPPLRTEEDRLAVIEGLKDGTIDMIATDHAPHLQEEKDRDIETSPNGVIGLESAFGVVARELYHERKWKLRDLVRIMSSNPARLIKKPDLGKLTKKVPANFVLVDLDQAWEFNSEYIRSKSRNSCFLGDKLRGRVLHTVVNGTHYDLTKK